MRYEWKDIPWKQIQVKLFKLQRRIYRASLRGDVKRVHRLQRLLMKSWYAKCLALRRVTQDNQGKKTAGVDGVKSLTPAQRLQLINSMDFKSKSKAVRRVWIPKPGKAEKRPLGIPTMHERALQALLKMVLEPEGEAKFEPNSYGFRPGRSAHDAIEAIFTAIAQKSKFVLDADIAQCFDKICHEELLRKMNTFSLAQRVIRGWLKAGVMDGNNLSPTSERTPQGGVIAEQIESLKAAPQKKVISDLNPAIRGWSNYYATLVSKETYSKLDALLFKKLWRWAKFRHPKKNKRWIANRYWHVSKGEGWKFGEGGIKLLRHNQTPIQRHTKVKGTASPYDGNWTYWSKTRGSYPRISTKVSTALKRQKGKCAECGLHFHSDDAIEIHHKDGNHRHNKMENLTAIHRHCHDRIHGGNGNLSTGLSTHAKGQSGEEPDERKLSRPVLKPSMGATSILRLTVFNPKFPIKTSLPKDREAFY